MQAIRREIEAAWEDRAALTPHNAPGLLKEAVMATIDALDKGHIRVAEKKSGQWETQTWIKQAVLLYFRLQENRLIKDQVGTFYDKVPLKFTGYTESDFEAAGIRVVPQALARKGSFIGSGTVLMPSYINIGAYVDTGCMIDTWATVGSCAQIGKRVHISGGVGIGGVLEPLQANPTIIEDDCFIGARSEVVEGVIVEAGSVLGMGVFISQSTKIYDRTTGEVFYGRVPAGSVVVPGSLPSSDGKTHLQCAVIVKRVDAQTRAKTSLNDLLRD